MAKTAASASANTPKEEAVATFTVETEPAETEVIIRKKKKKKKNKKYRYTTNTKNVQKIERGLSRSSRRIADAVADGFDAYYKRRNKSARKKKDGAILDYTDNLAYALSRGLRTASRAPYDLAKEIDTKTIGRQTRDVLSGVTTFFNVS